MASVDAVAQEWIEVKGARVHNLKGVDVRIPRNRLVVISGPSGSGKTSLAFDTLHAEGQRRYLESQTASVRQFVAQLERPDVDEVEGLQPTLAINQQASRGGPRSTVATMTDLYDYLRLLMARLGKTYCYRCGGRISRQPPSEILEAILALPERTRIMLLAPMVRGEVGTHQRTLEQIRKAGLVRLRVDGRIHDADSVPDLDGRKAHHLEAVVDRLVIRKGIRNRLADSLELTLKYGEGLVLLLYDDPAADSRDFSERLFSTEYACHQCGLSYEEIEPRTFSFNSPYGACPHCQGLGKLTQFDPGLVLPEGALSLAEGAIVPLKILTPARRKRMREQIAAYLQTLGHDETSPLGALQADQRQRLLSGDKRFPGVLALLEEQFAAEKKTARKEQLAAFRDSVPCGECGGTRLRKEARSVRLGEQHIGQITAQTVEHGRPFFAGLAFEPHEADVAETLVGEISSRLEFLQKVGLGYLTLDRSADTLSGGELQRIRLAANLGARLTGVCYILDEPSLGLHPRDNDRLIASLRELEQEGNSVLVVEHDEAMMQAADYLIDMGPAAGAHGGSVMASGSPQEVAAHEQSPTGRYLAGVDRLPLPPTRRATDPQAAIRLEGASLHNLQAVDIVVPHGGLTCVTGVSGSGKSSLIHDTLVPALRQAVTGSGKPGPFARLAGAEAIERVLEVDQSPLGRSPRSTPATATGIFDDLRKVFAKTKEARIRGFKAGRFSYNTKAGRCETCQGYGRQQIEMNFLPDVWITCPQCGGKRYNRQTLAIRYRGQSIADVLAMSVAEARAFFDAFEAVARPLQMLVDVGLGYLQLGQPANTLSGGEAQRVKLACELARGGYAKAIYFLDEPTTGLHFQDVAQLLAVLQRLVDDGHTVVVIEHHLDVIKSADWIIDLGPEGGDAGGRVVAMGTPEEVAAAAASITGRYLQPLLAERG